VKQDIVEMVPPRGKTIKMTIQHVGQPRHGVPIVYVTKRERPPYSIPGKAFLDVFVFCDIEIIIQIKEIMVLGLPIEPKNHDRQGEAYDKFSPGAFMQ
jgi:hypothetical protein